MSLAICIASGPSLTKEDVDYCRGKGRVYVINNTFQLAPWADVLYACDGRWWDHYFEEANTFSSSQFWTIDIPASDKYAPRLNLMGVLSDGGYWSKSPKSIAICGNSGHQALNLAYIQGATKIILLGYDMKPRADGIRHWHGDHVRTLLQTNPAEYNNWADNYKKASAMIDIPVVNCTRDSYLECFPKSQLRDEI